MAEPTTPDNELRGLMSRGADKTGTTEELIKNLPGDAQIRGLMSRGADKTGSVTGQTETIMKNLPGDTQIRGLTSRGADSLGSTGEVNQRAVEAIAKLMGVLGPDKLSDSDKRRMHCLMQELDPNMRGLMDRGADKSGSTS